MVIENLQLSTSRESFIEIAVHIKNSHGENQKKSVSCVIRLWVQNNKTAEMNCKHENGNVYFVENSSLFQFLYKFFTTVITSTREKNIL